MKITKGSRLRKFAVITGLNVIVASALAIPTNITTPSSAVGKNNLGNSTVLDWIGNEVSAYNRVHGASLPHPVDIVQDGQTGVGGTSATFNLTGDCDYLFLHWSGLGSGWVQAYYIGGEKGSRTFYSPFGGHLGGGLSDYSFCRVQAQGVADRGSTLLLTGLAFGGLTLFARRKEGFFGLGNLSS
jgi:hypothetical protein